MRLTLVDCTENYWEFIRTLRNDDRVKPCFINKAYITHEQQNAYMSKHSDFYKVCIQGVVPVGYVGVIESDIRICTHPDYQRLGIGLFMLREIMKVFPNSNAKIKTSNGASLKLFTKAGFVEESRTDDFIFLAYKQTV